MSRKMGNPNEIQVVNIRMVKEPSLYSTEKITGPEDVNRALEPARNDKIIGKSLDAEVTVYAKSDMYDFLKANEDDLAEIFITSKAFVDKDENAKDAFSGDTVKVFVKASEHEKCGRCWVRSETVGTIEGFPGICADCVKKLTK